MQERGEDSGLDGAIQRLDRALGLLESRFSGALRQAQASAGGLFDQDRAKLAEELDAARGREKALEAAGAEAARALGRAIEEIRAVLGDNKADDILEKEA